MGEKLNSAPAPSPSAGTHSDLGPLTRSCHCPRVPEAPIRGTGRSGSDAQTTTLGFFLRRTPPFASRLRSSSPGNRLVLLPSETHGLEWPCCNPCLQLRVFNWSFLTIHITMNSLKCSVFTGLHTCNSLSIILRLGCLQHVHIKKSV